MKRIILCTLAVLCLASVSAADIPRTLNYQGVLTDAGGSAVPDGSYSVTFRLYSVSSGGASLWEETQPVSVEKGIFSVILGSVIPLELPFNQRYYLGISVEGEAELAPRIALTAAPYSITSRGVEGPSNVFPPDGNVGIGTKTPSVPLQVTSASGQVGIRFNGNDAAWSSIYVNAQQPTARPLFGYLRGGVLKASSYVNPNGDWLLHVGATERMIVTDEGNVGIDDFAPDQKLTINGGVRISNTSTATGGSIRFTGSDFEGYDGSTWKSFTAGGGGGLPSGSEGQTLRHDGIDWIANGFLYNDGLHIGIGTASPTELVHIMGSGNERLKLESTDPSGSAAIRINTSGGGTFDYLNLQKSGPSAAGTVAGVPVANLSRVSAGADAGALMMHVSSDNPMHFATHNTEWMRIEGDGDLILFNQSHQELLHSWATGDGADISLYDNGGNTIMRLTDDPDGIGGEFSVARGPGTTGFLVDGNYTGSGEPLMAVYGSSQSVIFNMDYSGSSSASLPASAISDVEILDEPGVASYAQGTTAVELGTSFTIVGTRSIVTPTAGYVLVMANCGAEALHITGTTSRADFGVSDNPLGFPDNQELSVFFEDVLPTGIRHLPVSCHGLFEVLSSGTHTFYFIGRKTDGSFYFYDIQLTLIFFPTAYGDVNPTVAESGAPGTDHHIDASGAGRSIAAPVTDSDIARERADAEALHVERLERELSEIRAEMERLRREIKGR
jgi:hypothetical protein